MLFSNTKACMKNQKLEAKLNHKPVAFLISGQWFTDSQSTIICDSHRVPNNAYNTGNLVIDWDFKED